MSNITVHAGDFGEGKAALKSNRILLPIKKGQGLLNRDTISLNEIIDIDIATDESVKRIAGTLGWGVVGGIILGPVGLLAGLLLGGKKKEITFIAKFQGDRKMLATTNPKTYKSLVASSMEQK